ncbi:hypothetical protein, partial [Xinfangfangia pollutisoli]
HESRGRMSCDASHFHIEMVLTVLENAAPLPNIAACWAFRPPMPAAAGPARAADTGKTRGRREGDLPPATRLRRFLA